MLYSMFLMDKNDLNMEGLGFCNLTIPPHHIGTDDNQETYSQLFTDLDS